MSPQAFALDAPIPPGVFLVGASAGTGKTYSLVRLAARLLIEPTPGGQPPPTIEQLLIVTFTRDAATELLDRLRGFLGEAIAFLRDAPDEDALRTLDDRGLAALAVAHPGAADRADADVLAARCTALEHARRDLDVGWITTLHGFCERILRNAPLEGGSALEGVVIDDPSAMIDEAFSHALHHALSSLDEGTAASVLEAYKVSVLRQQAVAVIGAGPDVHIEPGLASPAGALDGFGAEARALGERLAGEEGVAWLDALLRLAADAGLNAQHGSPTKLQAAYDNACRALRRGEVTASPGLMAPSGLRKHLKKNRQLPEAPIADALDAWNAGRPQVDAALAAWRGALLVDVRRRFRDALDRVGGHTFDDLIRRADAAMADEAFVSGVRARFSVALVDEFQDTDAVQWRMLRRLFVEAPDRRLGLIGDPKQSIYAFRGADIAVYEAASQTVSAGHNTTLLVNHRSDGPLIEAVGHLFGGPNPFLTPSIPFVRVSAHKTSSRLVDAVGVPVTPLVLRWFDRADLGHVGEGFSFGAAAIGAEEVAVDEVVRTLQAGWRIEEGGRQRPLRASDIAVLARENVEAQRLYASLLRVGVPAVLASGVSIWQSVEARWLLLWLDAVLERRRDRPARALMILPWSGWTAETLAASREGTSVAAVEAWTTTVARLAAAGRRLETGSLAEAMQPFLVDPSPLDGVSATARLAGLPGGERHLANLRHLVELLDAERQARRLSPRALRRSLERRMADADEAEEDVELRLESDAEAVKVLTMHRSKGLEFPVVVVPRLFASPAEGSERPVRFHRGEQTILGLDGPKKLQGADAEAYRREGLQESQRLAYVALTRARHRVVAVATAFGTKKGNSTRTWVASPLALLIHGRASDDPIGAAGAFADAAVSSPQQVLDDVEAWAAGCEGVRLEYGLRQAATGAVALDPQPSFVPQIATFHRAGLDRWWRRASYTRLLDQRGLPPLPDPVEDVRDLDASEAEDGADAVPDGAPLDAMVEAAAASPGSQGASEVPMRGFLGGTRGGTWFHAVMEHLRFTDGAPRLGGDLAAMVRAQGGRLGVLGDEAASGAAVLVEALPLILRTPLGGPLGARTLAEVSDDDRLDELAFDVAVGAGDGRDDGRRLLGRDLAACLGTPRANGPYPEAYLEKVRTLPILPLRGYFTGAIDLVMRAPVDGHMRWFVADYKTNVLGERGPDGRLIASRPQHFGPAGMTHEMCKKHYDLQYTFYLLALHRYLRLRLSGYDYDRDVGGAYYLFVRGMLGPSTSPGHGVFFDRPPRAVIERLDALFADPPAEASR
jgi:exodeoxyribonuclease V beta subunit